jgi:hypothetical protein
LCTKLDYTAFNHLVVQVISFTRSFTDPSKDRKPTWM